MNDLKRCPIIEFEKNNKYGDFTKITKDLSNLIKKMNNLYDTEQDNFVMWCYYVYNVKQLFQRQNELYYGRLFDKSGKHILFNTIMANFGFDDSQVTRFIKCYEKYIIIDNDKPKFDNSIFNFFNKSKLIELLSVPNEQILEDLTNNVITVHDSVIRIREYVKNYKAMQNQNKKLGLSEKEIEENSIINDESIPDAYNPKLHYDFAYFEDKSKAQLLNIVWELQKEYEKLKYEIKK